MADGQRNDIPGANKNLMAYWIRHLSFGRNTSEARRIFTNVNEQEDQESKK